MAPASTTQNYKLWIVALNGKALGTEDQVITNVRELLNVKYAAMGSLPVLVAAFSFGVLPIVECMRAALSPQAFANCVFALSSPGRVAVVAKRLCLAFWHGLCSIPADWIQAEGPWHAAI